MSSDRFAIFVTQKQGMHAERCLTSSGLFILRKPNLDLEQVRQRYKSVNVDRNDQSTRQRQELECVYCREPSGCQGASRQPRAASGPPALSAPCSVPTRQGVGFSVSGFGGRISGFDFFGLRLRVESLNLLCLFEVSPVSPEGVCTPRDLCRI